MSERKTEWFIEPDALTNQILAGGRCDAEECPDMLCGDGQRRNLWRVSAHEVAMFHRDRIRLNLHFTTFSRVDNRGIHVSFLYNSPQVRAAWTRALKAA